MSFIKRALAALAIGAMAVLAAPAGANASTTTTAAERIAAMPTSGGAETAAQFHSCAFDAHGHRGYRICETSWDYYDWGNGNVEYFVIGTDWSVWHIWKGASGWKSLGGHALKASGNGVGFFTSPRYGVVTIGTDGNGWCRYRGNGNWAGGWQRCG